MNIYFRIFISLSFILNLKIFAQDSQYRDLKPLLPQFERGEESDLNYAKRMVKEVRKSSKDLDSYLKFEAEEDRSSRDMEVCVECDKMLALTKSVNSILEKHALYFPDKEDLLLESKNLETIVTYMEMINRDGNRECIKGDNLDITDEFRNVKEEDLTLVFSEKGHFENLSSFRFDSSEREVTFLRGTGADIDKMVKVEVLANGETTISYYRIKNVNGVFAYKTDQFKDQLDRLPDLNRIYKEEQPKEPSTSRSGNLDGQFVNDEWESDTSRTKAKLGPRVEYEDYIPKKLSLAEVENEYRPNDTTLIQSELEISTKRTRARTTLSNDLGDGDRLENTVEVDQGGQKIGVKYVDGDGVGVKSRLNLSSSTNELEVELMNTNETTIFRTRASDDGSYSVGVPYDSRAGNVQMKGEVSHDSTGRSQVNLDLSYDGDNLFNTTYINAEDEKVIILSKDRELEDNARVSFKIENRENRSSGTRDNTFWLTYKKQL